MSMVKSPVGDRYHIIEGPLYDGATEVYRAFDLTNEHGEVAVKVLPGGNSAGPLHFQRERDALQRLSHKNVVRLLDTGQDATSSRRFLVFPWLSRRLQEMLVEGGALSWDEWWSGLGSPILDGIEAAHALEIQHRDLKPANVLIDEDGTPKVIDFGIAKLNWEAASDATVSAGSPPFTPRELVMESPAMTRDTHAWAALTVFALSGVDPYRDPSRPYETLSAAHREARLALPETVRPLIDRCLSSDPSERPASAGVLRAELAVAIEKVSRATAEDRRNTGPAVHLHFRESVLEGLESELYFDRRRVVEYVNYEVEGEVFADSRVGGDFSFSTASLQLRSKVDAGGERLIVVSAFVRDPSSLDRERERSWRMDLRLTLDDIRDRVFAADGVAELSQRIGEHRQARRQKEAEGRRGRPFVIWRGLLALLRSFEERQESPVEYWQAEPCREGVRFLCDETMNVSVGERRVATHDSKKDFSGTVVSVKADSVVVAPDPSSGPPPTSSGVLRQDRRAGQAGIERQQRALDAVEYGRAVRPDLADLMARPETARVAPEDSAVAFAQDLDEAKQDAVKAALASEDILIVRGPPGTGKTTFISELVIQELRRDPGARILIASQSHAAVDHALAAVHRCDERVSLLRIARDNDERVAQGSTHFLMKAHLEAWRKEVVAQGERELKTWAKSQGIDIGAVDSATRLTTLAAELRKLAALDAQRSKIDEALAELRGHRGDATQGATSSQAVAARSLELDEVRETTLVTSDIVREQIASLVKRKRLDRDVTPKTLDPDNLELEAIDLLPGDEEAADECRKRLALLSGWHAEFGTGPAFQAAALMRSQIVAATCVGLGALRGFDSVPHDLVIVDEASKATGPELFIPLARARRIVLVGDDRQLPPYVEHEALDPEQLEERGLTSEEMTRPLFVSLSEGLPPGNVRTLRHQHRMHPAIGQLVSNCFYDGELTSTERTPAKWLELVAPKPVTWLTTSADRNRRERRRGVSVTNPHEVEIVASFLGQANLLAGAGKASASVVVLTGYAAQRDALEERVAPVRQEWANLHVECHTVDAFQGREADVVIYSLTRSNPDRQLGFVRDPPRLNVAFSRARDALVIVGDDEFARAARGGGRLSRVLDYISDNPDDCVMRRPEVGRS